MANDKEITIKVQLDGTKGVVKDSTKVQHSIREIGEEGDKSGKQLNKMGQQSRFLQGRLGSMATIAGGAAAAALGTTLFKATERAIQKGREFESTLAELEAITGITGQRLDTIGDKALELSKEYATSASDIVEAHKLVASQLAEKIDFGTDEGMRQLQEISEQAVVLKTAAGIELSEAVQTTTSVMNQFNLEAEESERVINTLAAGSKYGAAEVGDIRRAMVNAGSAAAGAGASIEETNSAIQVLAANGQRGERAGTALRAIFTRLQTSGEQLAEQGIKNVDVEANGLTETLRQLEPILDDTTAMKQIFGEEALNQIQILVREADAVESLNEKVTDTSTAYEQSETNLNTFDAAQQNLVNTIDAELIPAFQESNGVLVKLMNSVAGFIERTGNVITKINRWMDVHSEIRSEMEASETATNSQIQAMRDLRKELAEAAQEGELSADQEKELRKAYEQTNQTLLKRASRLRDETEGLKERKKEIQSQIDSLDRSDFPDPINYRNRLDELKEDLQGVEMEIESNEEQLDRYHDALEEGSISFDEYIEKIKQAAEAEEEAGDQSGKNEEQQKNLAEQYQENEERINELLNVTGEWTKSQREEYQQLVATNKAIDEQREKRKQLAEITKPDVELETPEDQIISADINVGEEEGFAGVTIYEEQMAKEAEFTELQREMSRARQEYRNAETEHQRRLADEKMNMIQAEMDMRQQLVSLYQHSIMAQIETGEQLLNHVLQTTKRAIKAKIAEATAEQVLNALSSVPFPANIAAAAAAGGTVSLLFEKVVPEFNQGGVLSGPSHAQGGITVVKRNQPIAEAEGNEAIINARSTKMFYDELSAINEAGGGKPFPKARSGDRFQSGGPLGPVPQRPEGGLGSTASDSFNYEQFARVMRQELENADIVAVMKDSIEDLHERLNDVEEWQNRIGN